MPIPINSMLKSVVDLHTKVSGERPPQLDLILSFLHNFLPKSAHVGRWRPPKEGWGPSPNGKSWIRPCQCKVYVHGTYWYFTQAGPCVIGVKWSKLVQEVGSSCKTMVCDRVRIENNRKVLSI